MDRILTEFELYVMNFWRNIQAVEITITFFFKIESVVANILQEKKAPLTFCQTVTRAKSVDNRLRRTYNLLEDNLVPVDLTRLRTVQKHSQLKKISDLYVRSDLYLYETLCE